MPKPQMSNEQEALLRDIEEFLADFAWGEVEPTPTTCMEASRLRWQIVEDLLGEGE